MAHRSAAVWEWPLARTSHRPTITFKPVYPVLFRPLIAPPLAQTDMWHMGERDMSTITWLTTLGEMSFNLSFVFIHHNKRAGGHRRKGRWYQWLLWERTRNSFTFTFDSAQGVFMVLSRTANKTGNLNCREKNHTHNQRVKPSNLTRIGSKVIHFLLRPEHKNGKKTTFAANAVGPLTGLERTQKLPMTFTVCCLDCCGTKWHYTGVNCA